MINLRHRILRENGDSMTKKVFLGGTCNNDEWREKLIPMLQLSYFNPVVKDWTPECQAEERKQREICDICLYTITPAMMGVYSIAELTQDSNKRPDKTVMCILSNDSTGKLSFTDAQMKSLVEVGKLVESNGAKVFNNLKDLAEYLNKLK